MRIAVVDDESIFRKQTASAIVSLYGRENVSCFLYSDGSELLRSIANGFELDAVFLDIEMKDVDGMSCAKAIRKVNRDIPIVFLTSHTEMAMEGYEVDAFRFLAKPVEPDKLRATLLDLERMLKEDEKIVLREDGEDVILPVKDLIYAEASNNSVRFVFRGSSHETRMKFSDAVRTIDSLSRDFLKVHRSYVVSLAHIRKVNSGEILMDNGDTVPVARGKAVEVRERLFEFIRRTGR